MVAVYIYWSIHRNYTLPNLLEGVKNYKNSTDIEADQRAQA